MTKAMLANSISIIMLKENIVSLTRVYLFWYFTRAFEMMATKPFTNTTLAPM